MGNCGNGPVNIVPRRELAPPRRRLRFGGELLDQQRWALLELGDWRRFCAVGHCWGVGGVGG